MGKSPDEAAEELCELALKLGSSDNVTVILIQFDYS
jgi:serine/threonine protein phosphatase PrpC